MWRVPGPERAPGPAWMSRSSAPSGSPQQAQVTCGRVRLPRLPYPDAAFDVGYWADTLEITPDLDAVLAEATRVLRPGGVLLYNTVARTRLSRLIYLGVLQSWSWTRIAPPGRYAWDRLRDPDDLARSLAEYGLRNEDVRGFLPAGPIRMVQATRRARRGFAVKAG
jgi:2-polyprenyl-6-hydroxyphenyl methylase/3-demethylubiquinone-9 3-methyltransferase